jgi:hypothetical protein
MIKDFDCRKHVMKMLRGKEVLKSFTIGNIGRLNTLNPSSAICRTLLEVSASYPEISNSIYLEATA